MVLFQKAQFPHLVFCSIFPCHMSPLITTVLACVYTILNVTMKKMQFPYCITNKLVMTFSLVVNYSVCKFINAMYYQIHIPFISAIWLLLFRPTLLNQIGNEEIVSHFHMVLVHIVQRLEDIRREPVSHSPCYLASVVPIGLLLIPFFKEIFSQEFVIMSVLYLNWLYFHSAETLTLWPDISKSSDTGLSQCFHAFHTTVRELS